MPKETDQPIIFFDGVCNLCNGSVQFVIRHDNKKQFLFAALQSPMGEQALQHVAGKEKKPVDSIILYKKGKYYSRSDAAMQIIKELGGFWRLGVVLYIFPASLRNGIYDWVARNRYKWFGKQNECMIPTPELKSRFLTE
jgi:predicted DCC family thiol-disulfide oxidoreductase YuxK